jgi:membrane protease YdiL (CAAX protease family)
VRNCPACGATAPADASWCGQCYAPLAGATPAGSVASAAPELAHAGSASATGPSTVGRFGLPVPEPTLPATSPAPVAPMPAAYFAPDGYVLVPASYVPGTDAPAEGSMLSRRASILVGVSIGVGVLASVVSSVLGHDSHLEPATYLRYALILTLGVYLIVGALIVTQLVPGIRLRWSNGSPARSVLVGAGLGGAVSAALLTIASRLAGHLAPDPRMVTLMSEGDLAHIVITLGIVCVCAPLIEETLFRGLLLESKRWRSRQAALWISAACFAVWHLQIAIVPLVYYSLMGLLLGTIYVKRGLAGSMAAHFAFNGVLAVAALSLVLSPGKTFAVGDVSIHAPSGWSQHNQYDAPSSALALEGPSGAAAIVLEMPTQTAVSPQAVLRLLQTDGWRQLVPNVDVTVDNARQVQLPAGSAVEADITAEGHSGSLVFVPEQSKFVEVIFISAGSEKARADFPHMLDSLRVG